MRALLVGTGRMSTAIADVLAARGHAVAGRIGRNDSLEAADPAAVDLAFEFTEPLAAPTLVDDLLELGIPTVSGTTGWDVDEAVRTAAEESVGFLHAPNFSVGVAALRAAVAAAARALAAFPEFEPAIVDRHHGKKKDAPSGTAGRLAADVAAARGRGDVPIVSLRHGGHPGEHLVVFEGPEESVELVHRARSRAIFALGAVRAGEWLLASGRKGPATFDEFLAEVSR